MKRALLLVILAALAAGCAREKRGPAHGLPTGDGVWFEEGIGAAEEDLEAALARAGLVTVFVPAARLSRVAGHWEVRLLAPPPRPFLRESVFLVVGADAAAEDALSRRGAAGPLADAAGLAVRGALQNAALYGRVSGLHFDFPFSPKTAQEYGTLLSGLRPKIPRGTLVSVSLRFAPSPQERKNIRPLASACDGFVAFVFGEGNAADPLAVDELGKDWRALYAPSARGFWQGAGGENRGGVPEWVLARLSDDPRVEFLEDVSLKDESDQSFVFRPRVPVSLGERLSFGARDRLSFRQPLVSDMIYHLGADLAGRRFARGRVVALPGRSESERLFTLAALHDVLLGKPAQPELHVTTETGRSFVTVSAENTSPHASFLSRTSNWVELRISSGGIRDVQPGGFDRFEVYGRDHRPVTLGLATIVRFYETLIDPFEKIEPARILLRRPPPKECCQVRFHVLGASGGEILSDSLAVPSPR